VFYLWEQLWDLFRQAFILVINLQWGAIAGMVDRFADWWDELWRLIEVRLQGLWGSITQLGDHFAAEISRMWQFVYGHVGDVVSPILDEIASIWAQLTQITATITDLVITTVQDWLAQAGEFLQTIVDAVMPLIMPLIDAVQLWVQDTFGWLAGLELIIAQWLPSVIGVIDWLKDVAWPALVAFLSDPLGYVLGALFAPISNVLNWWETWGQSLDYFVTEQLPDLGGLLGLGLTFLAEFVERPAEVILDRLEDVFLGWLERLIADNW